jgi:hypothetical protein
MKANITLILFAILTPAIIVSCKKEAAQTSIIGAWELREASGQTTLTYPAGNGQIIEFTDTNYKTYFNGQLVKSGNYSIEVDSTVRQNVCLEIPSAQFTNRLKFENDSSFSKTFMQLSPGKLILVSGCFAYDAGSFRTYFAIKNNP